ncbi:hypothetical protein AVBRAN12640_06190 [Campylobacter sp. RM12640]|uniref:hypothetical protein n=1 Tax=unclassified Campylobacter TaxID=2593542 RepID=UPI001DF3D272|nr:hypothetical protein [Campylobacter sp. RM12640]MBZ7989698.1 hypothetical protein [Campylobacter sp. RM12635]MBZ7991756.1 hypothetical protein [Campylobacter sp. RM9331]MBZ8005190.1 hypothetical protein [Campylobacter sp. RM9332]
MQTIWNVISIFILILLLGASWENTKQRQLLNQALEQSEFSRQIAENAIKEIRETQKINDELLYYINKNIERK